MQRAFVDRAKRGDAEAFDALARTVGDRCMAIACRILRDADSSIAFTLDPETFEILDYEALRLRGPHPQAESGFTAFCEVFVAALA